ncbi:MAG: class I SAM-dependent methyltransferase [Candidatus Dormibacteria bacterium]
MSEQQAGFADASLEEGIRFHYDLPPGFFRLFLDRASMSYTCAYFRDGETSLEEAQQRKLELVARKLQLRPTDRVLDIGCGWGNMLFYAAERGCRVTGITLALEQAEFIRREAHRRGIQDRVEVLVQEAGLLPFEDRSFDRIVTIGATEQVTDIHLLFRECRRILEANGLMLNHAITAAPEEVVDTFELRFMRRHIFPTGELKPLKEYIQAFEGAELEVIHVHDITDHYPLTLRHWLRNLEAAGIEAAEALGVPAERWRAQRLFLAGCAVIFSESHALCYQQLVRPVEAGRRRRPLPAGQALYELEDPPAVALPTVLLEAPLLALEVTDGPSLYVDGESAVLTAGDPPRQPDCRIRVDMATLAEIAGDLSGLIDAYLQGRVEVDGDLIVPVQLREALAGVGAQL